MAEIVCAWLMEYKMHSWSPMALRHNSKVTFRSSVPPGGVAVSPRYHQLIPCCNRIVFCHHMVPRPGTLSETWIPAGLDGASAFVESPVGAEAVQAVGH